MTALAGRRLLIAGAGGGVGGSLARSAAATGAHVLLLGRARGPLDVLRRAIEADGGRASAAVADATVSDDLTRAVAALRREAGGIDALVNTIGVNIPRRRLAELDGDDWRRVLDVNLTAALLLTQQVLPGFRRQGDGQIVHIASTAARAADLSGAAYQASKAGLGALARATSIEARGDGVRVTTIYPGLIATDFVRHRARPPALDELDRALQPEDVASMCLAILTMPPRAHVDELVMTPTRA